jgi:hypothetical protein
MKQHTRRIGYVVLITSDFILVFFSHFSLFNGSEASNNCPLSIIICPLFFLRKSAKRIGRFLGYSPCYYKHRKSLKMGEEKLKKISIAKNY